MATKKRVKTRRGRGEGSIFQRSSDGLWVASVVVGYSGEGKPKRKTVYGKTKEAVQSQLLGLQNKAAAGTLDTTKMTVAEFLAYWLDNAIKDRKDSGTEHLYRQRVKDHILPFLGGF